MEEKENKITTTPEDILLDIYFYQREFEKATRNEDIKFFKEKIDEAEELYKQLKSN